MISDLYLSQKYYLKLKTMAKLRKRLLLTCTMIFSLGICSATITTEYQNEEWEEITVRELLTRNRDYSYQVCTNAEDSCTVTILYNQWLSDLEEKNVLDSIALWGPKFEQSIKDIALQRKEVFGNIENINFKSFYKQNKNMPGRWFLVEYEEITWEEAHRRRLNIALEMARDEKEAIQAREEYDSYMTMLEECGAPGGSMATWFGYTPDDIRNSIISQQEDNNND